MAIMTFIWFAFYDIIPWIPVYHTNKSSSYELQMQHKMHSQCTTYSKNKGVFHRSLIKCS